MRHLAPLVNPVVSVLPAPIAGGQLMYQGKLYTSEGTTWTAAGGGDSAGVMTGRALIDCGALPTLEFYGVISDANITLGSRVFAQISDVAPTGKDADEMEMDVIDVWCRVTAAGKADVRLTGMSGWIADKFNIDYIIVKG